MTGQNAEGQERELSEIQESSSTEVRLKCVEITKKYHSGIITKVTAILKLQQAIPHDDEDTFLKSLGAYIRVLDNFERIHKRAAPRGRSTSRDVEGEQDEPEDKSEADPINEVPRRTTKRGHSQSTSSDDGSATRRKIDAGSFPWVIRDTIDPPELSASLRQTQSILENFSRDPKFARASLLNSARLPQFPDSEWTNLIAGRAIDLDHVLSGQYSVSHDGRRTERVGQVEFMLRPQIR
jgi:hypothetical protein